MHCSAPLKQDIEPDFPSFSRSLSYSYSKPVDQNDTEDSDEEVPIEEIHWESHWKSHWETDWETAFDLVEEPLIKITFCTICYDNTFHTVTLDCGHTHCRRCTVELIGFYVSCNIIYEKNMKCPTCKDSIKLNSVRHLLPQSTRRRLGYLRKAAKIETLILSNKAMWCPAPNCSGFAIVTEGVTLSCRKCRVLICQACSCFAHHQMTCEEFFQEFGSEEGRELASLILKRKWRQCPYCKYFVDKIDGCNHMECFSTTCGGANGFCYLCGKGLTHLSDQYSHFGKWGSSSTMCNTLGSVEED